MKSYVLKILSTALILTAAKAILPKSRLSETAVRILTVIRVAILIEPLLELLRS